ncbi:MAG: class I SAM-dependent methyltransferase [Ignavibacteriaceae bacterium]|nr:class I SAM-dependent methyltransferase [Ignavibacteriaceae bacterium]
MNYCPVCCEKEFKILGNPKPNVIAQQIITEEYKIVECINCHTYFVHPRINFTKMEWESLYNTEYFSQQSQWLLKKRTTELKTRFDNAQKYFTNSKEIAFLDIGTGEGKALIEGYRRGWKVMGIDIVDNRIEEAKSIEIKFLKTNFLEQEIQENSFDFIYCDSVIEHVLNPFDYLLKIKKLLKVGGILYIGVPNEDSLFNFIRKLIFTLIYRSGISEKLKPFDSPYHVVGFNKESLNFLINKTGLKIVFFRNFGRKLDFLSYPFFKKGFWISLIFLFPIEVLGNLLKRDVYFEVYLQKNK